MADSEVETVGRSLREWFGEEPAASAAVTFVGTEQIEVRCYLAQDSGRAGDARGPLLRFVSVGCSRSPMADPTDMIADPLRGPRAEVVVSLRPLGGIPTGLHKSVAVLAAAPAVEGVVLEADGIVDLSEPMWQGAGFTAVLLSRCDVPDVTLEPPREPVRFLEAVPITATEAAWVRVRGADELREAWAEAGIDPHDPTRRAAEL